MVSGRMLGEQEDDEETKAKKKKKKKKKSIVSIMFCKCHAFRLTQHLFPKWQAQ